MTPLAMQIVKELTIPVKDRSFADGAKILTLMSGVHCFECTAVAQVAHEIGKQALVAGHGIDTMTFLPAPKTWIELVVLDQGERFRWGFFLHQKDNSNLDIFMASSDGQRFGSMPYVKNLNIVQFVHDTHNTCFDVSDFLKTKLPDVALHTAGFLLGALAIINSPRIIGRRQHMAHRGLERELVKQQKVIGKFPLHAWTEIVLDVTPPKEAAGQHDYEAHLTGRRALHFVRAHLRIRDGQLSFVKAHWRGDASIGIKQSRYTVKNRRAA